MTDGPSSSCHICATHFLNDYLISPPPPHPHFLKVPTTDRLAAVSVCDLQAMTFCRTTAICTCTVALGVVNVWLQLRIPLLLPSYHVMCNLSVMSSWLGQLSYLPPHSHFS